ncbi:MAG TPA: hypothetical protein VGD61_20305 [Pyrinomonadaceae bacterium]
MKKLTDSAVEDDIREIGHIDIPRELPILNSPETRSRIRNVLDQYPPEEVRGWINAEPLQQIKHGPIDETNKRRKEMLKKLTKEMGV